MDISLDSSKKSMDTLETLLIYIPCHEDYRGALVQLDRINSVRSRVMSIGSTGFKIATCVSMNCNSIPQEILEELSQKSDELIDFGREINGDANINLGFLHGLRTRSDFLWILSANDLLRIEAIPQIMSQFASKDQPDVVVGSRGDTLGLFQFETILGSNLPELAFGLISSVVYRTSSINSVAHLGLQLSWTGWGQLAVLEAACIQNTNLKVFAIREELMHERSRYPDQEIWKYREGNWLKYSHSFPGLPVLISLIYASNERRARELVEAWILRMWSKRNFFLRLRADEVQVTPNNRANHSYQSSWSRLLLPNAIRLSRIQYRILFFLGRLVPDVRFFLRFKIFRSITKKRLEL